MNDIRMFSPAEIDAQEEAYKNELRAKVADLERQIAALRDAAAPLLHMATTIGPPTSTGAGNVVWFSSDQQHDVTKGDLVVFVEAFADTDAVAARFVDIDSTDAVALVAVGVLMSAATPNDPAQVIGERAVAAFKAKRSAS